MCPHHEQVDEYLILFEFPLGGLNRFMSEGKSVCKH